MAEAGRAPLGRPAPLGDAALLARMRGALGAQPAWLVGGAVRDRLLGRIVTDVDLVVADPAAAARAIRGALGGTLFALSERHGAWRLTLDDGRTVDTSPLGEGIEADLARRDFTVNAMAAALDGGPLLDPHGGALDLEQRVLRPVSDGAFRDDPVRLLRAVRFECELGLRLEAGAEALVRRDAALVSRPAGERLLAELERLPADGFRRLAALGLLDPLGGSPALLDAVGDEPTPEMLLVAVFGRRLAELPIPGELRRMAQRVLSAEPPPDADVRAIHRFRRHSEPWAVEALLLARRPELVAAVEAARAGEPVEPLLRGDELGIPPGRRVGVLLERIAEERAAGTIASREEALALVARLERETERGHE